MTHYPNCAIKPCHCDGKIEKSYNVVHINGECSQEKNPDCTCSPTEGLRERWREDCKKRYILGAGQYDRIVENAADWWLNELSLAREEAFGRGVEAVKSGDVPMGVSQWQNHGAKYGYAEYFEDRLKKQREEILAIATDAIRKCKSPTREKSTKPEDQLHEARTIYRIDAMDALADVRKLLGKE